MSIGALATEDDLRRFIDDVLDGVKLRGDQIALDLTGSPLPGDLRHTARSSAPAGWLICDGSAVSRTTYAALFAAISTTHGVGDGSTTFNLPDYRGRTLVAPDSGAGRVAASTALGAGGGEENHTLTTPEIPSHTHPNATSAVAGGGGAGTIFGGAGNTATGATGGGGAHNNMQPYGIANTMVKT